MGATSHHRAHAHTQPHIITQSSFIATIILQIDKKRKTKAEEAGPLQQNQTERKRLSPVSFEWESENPPGYLCTYCKLLQTEARRAESAAHFFHPNNTNQAF